MHQNLVVANPTLTGDEFVRVIRGQACGPLGSISLVSPTSAASASRVARGPQGRHR